MSTKSLWGLLKYIPKVFTLPWHFPVTTVFCKCGRHIKLVGITNPSKALHTIWMLDLFLHSLFAILLLGIFIVQINLTKPTLSIIQAILYLFLAIAGQGVAGPLFLVFYLARDGKFLTELMKLESRILEKKRKNEFRSKWYWFVINEWYCNFYIMNL